jgi:MerR family transcriptional regulator, thiopeptide resistance regulator
MYRISTLGQLFGLSRSTLLYYHRIGLLSPSVRTRANYRLYSEKDRARLESICTYRQAGLSMDDIRELLALESDDTTEILQRRLQSLGTEIRALQTKQRLLADMLSVKAKGWKPTVVDKAAWVEMLQNAGMSEAAMDAWHREFETRAPEAHLSFLMSLGISSEEATRIREHSRSRG